MTWTWTWTWTWIWIWDLCYDDLHGLVFGRVHALSALMVLGFYKDRDLGTLPWFKIPYARHQRQLVIIMYNETISCK
jgi:hypothetical protein